MRKDRTNKKYGMLTFIQSTDKTYNNGAVMWEAKCDCGNTTYTSYGMTKSCGCLRSVSSNINGKNSRRYEPHISSARKIYTHHYRDCDFETFYTLSQLPCHYCGRPPHNTTNIASHATSKYKYSDEQKQNGNFTYNGLDRIDNNKGHIKNNIVPCCATCNYMKRTMGYKEFLEHIDRMYKHIHSKEFIGHPAIHPNVQVDAPGSSYR